ncbi:MAG: PAS domain S-box protein [Elusimicrobia bacterium]|nr:PAS domain S-box protein [Elusimicrobiota bacterium]
MPRHAPDDRPPLAAAAELCSELLGRVGFDGSLEALNPAWEAALGWSREELRRTRLLELVVEEDRAALVAALETAARSDGGGARIESRCRRRDGATALLDWRLKADFAREAFVAAARDVTAERGLRERALREQKTGQLGRLTLGLAHDFNNVLTLLQGSLAMLRDDHADADARLRELDEMRAAVECAGELARAMTELGRCGEEGGGSCDLNGVVRRMKSILLRLLRRDVVLDVRLDERLGRVPLDEVRAEQILLNLAVNARDAMVAGGRLTIETALLGERASLEVRDDGVGIPPELLERVFEPFFTTKRPGEGSGLGLATVREIAEGRGGRVEVRSRLGAGTSVVVSLPLV